MWSDLRIVLFFYWPREKGGEKGGKNKYIHKTLSSPIRTKYNATYTYIHIYIERRESTLPAKLCHCANTFPSVIAHLPYRFTFLFPSAFKSSISRVASSFRAKKSFFQESKENVSIVTKILVGGEDPRLQDAHKKWYIYIYTHFFKRKQREKERNIHTHIVWLGFAIKPNLSVRNE